MPLAILAFALATSSIFLSVMLLVLWLQRRRIAPHFQPPWEQPDNVKNWLDRHGPKRAATPNVISALLLKWLDQPPYQDPPALKEWVQVRLASALIAAFGVLFLARMLARALTPNGV